MDKSKLDFEHVKFPFCPGCNRIVTSTRVKYIPTGAYVSVYFCTKCKGVIEPDWKEAPDE